MHKKLTYKKSGVDTLSTNNLIKHISNISNKTKIHKNRDSFLDKLTEKVKDFLDNAE